MSRPIKWSRDLHPIRERAARSHTETWSRKDIQRLFEVGPSSAQNLMKAIGEVQTVGHAHFIARTSLLSFLDEMIAADSMEAAMRNRILGATAPAVPKPLFISLPADLRNVMLRDLPETIQLSRGRLEISASDSAVMLESLALLAQALQNDLCSAQLIWDPAFPATSYSNDDLRVWLGRKQQRVSNDG